MEDIAQAMRYTIDVKNGLLKQPMTGELMRGDKNANRIIVHLVDGSNDVLLDGVTVTGKFFRGGDGIDIPLEGEANGNEASVLLDEHCYAVDGYFEASVKLTTGTQTRTILTITGNVVSDGEGGILDIENVIPSVADIVAQYQRMQEVTEQTKSAMQAANTATINADKATKNANTAANAANTAATNANAAADAANAAAKDWGDSTAANSDKLGGKAPEYYLQPMNLLDNSDLTNPVNQRGVTSETDILRYAYFIDRWHNSSDITTKYGLSNQGVTISGDAGISQYIEGIESGTVLTAAVKYGGKIICVTGTIEYNGTSYKTIAHYGDGTANVFLVTKGGNAGIMISKDTSVSSITVEWAALYEGSYTSDTLPPYVPKGYAAELAECQRYYQIRSANNIAAVDMRPTMRITSPTIVSVSGGYAYSADL